MRRRCAFALVALGVATVWLPLGASPAGAAFPGSVGRIGFVSDRDDPTGQLDIYTMNPDGSNPARVTSDPADDVEPRFSADGNDIVFASDREGGDNDVYMTHDDGGFHKVLTANDAFDDTSASLDLADDVVIFQTDRDGLYEIYSMEDNGDAPKNLTLTPLADDVDPAVCADGRIVFATDRLRDPGDYEIYSMRLDGSDVMQLTDSDDGVFNRMPACSPNSKEIAFVSDDDDDPDIYVMDADGKNVEQLTGKEGAEDADDLNPAWSPDGKRIAFDTDRDDEVDFTTEIYVMDADGTDNTRLTDNGVLDEQPDWQAVADHQAFGEREGLPVEDATERGSIGGEPKAAAVPASAPSSSSSGSSSSGSATVASAATEPEVVVVKEASDAEPASSSSSLWKIVALASVVTSAVLAFLLARRRITV